MTKLRPKTQGSAQKTFSMIMEHVALQRTVLSSLKLANLSSPKWERCLKNTNHQKTGMK